MADEPKIYVTLEEAQKCYQCAHPGELKWNNAIAGGTLLSIVCKNQVCPWYDTSWLVELDSDGKVKVNEKAYNIAHGRSSAKIDPLMDQKVEQVHRALDGMIEEMERNPGFSSGGQQ